MRVVTFRFIVPALLLVLTLIWFNDRIHLLPARDAVAAYVKQLSAATPESAYPSDVVRQTPPAGSGTTATPDPAQSPTITIATTLSTDDAASTTPSQATAPLESTPQTPSDPTVTAVVDKVVVMGKLRTEDTSWVADKLPDWQAAIYHVDESNQPLSADAPFLTTSINKGHEALPYLTYIIDNYANLPSIMAFVHSHEQGWPKAWHTDAMGYSNVASLRSLNLAFVQQTGYTNLRCVYSPGCPAEIQPFRLSSDDEPADYSVDRAYATAWEYIFEVDAKEVPEVVAAACCAQFAVARWQVLARPKEFYIRAREWLLETDLDDATSGRVFEYMWHVFFGRDAVHCPELEQCWKDVYNKQTFHLHG